MRIDAAAWDEHVEKKTAELAVPPPGNTRSACNFVPDDEDTRRKQAIEIVTRARGKRPEALTHLESRCSIVRGLLGLHSPYDFKKNAGRKRKHQGSSSSSSTASSKKPMTSPARRQRIRKNNLAASSRAAAGMSSKKAKQPHSGTHQYPCFRLEAGKGLVDTRLSNDALKLHRPRSVVSRKKGATSKRHGHRCQVCRAVGPKWPEQTYRGGSKFPRLAKSFLNSSTGF